VIEVESCVPQVKPASSNEGRWWR